VSERTAAIDWRLFARDADDYWIPGTELARGTVEAPADPDGQWVEIPIGARFGESPGYVHVAVVSTDPDVRIGVSRARPLGPVSWRSHEGVDARPEDRRAELGWRSPHHSYVVSFWSRADHYWGGPPGPAIAFLSEPKQRPATAMHVLDPWDRPTPAGVHGWSSALVDGECVGSKYLFAKAEWLELRLPEPVDVEFVEIYFNSDVDRHLANMWYSYPPGFRAMSTLVADFDLEVMLEDGSHSHLAEVRDNYRRRFRASVGGTIVGLRVTCLATNGERFASIADVRVGCS
jgi:hypothetical protein